ncbi:Isochorismatase hydrolase [Coprinopsis marcescibilis]|uniref:Isochorismatase hydrolase n=1 Tax=Coprinopsis marcescibilis TaxID=230819 RepID=A0A5C3L2T1_COPMA|nr:Isochorismatase hydrolase [Coprinopsis marcescibilis]
MPASPSPAPSTMSAAASLSEGSSHVLLLLDIQRFMLSAPPIGVPSAKTVEKNLREVLKLARSSPHPPLIVHVRNIGDAGEPDEPGNDGWQLIFDPLPNEVVLDKRKNNAFAGTGLGELVPLDAEIVVVGFQTDFSVRATCGTALGRGNEVILVRGAHATFDRIEVLHGGGVTAAAVIEAEIEAELEEAGVHILEMKDIAYSWVDR